MTASKIEWTDRSDWNPIRGCTRVSPGCGGPGEHGGCYAEAMAARFSDPATDEKPAQWGHGFAERTSKGGRWTGKVELQEDRLLLPLKWKKPARVFAASTSDIFHESMSDEDIARIFSVMAMTPHLTFQVLTKRSARMRQWFAEMTPIAPPMNGSSEFSKARGWTEQWANLIALERNLDIPWRYRAPGHGRLLGFHADMPWPLPNVWLGVSVENQQYADERIPDLLATPAAVRFLSCEPLLGPISITDAMWAGPAFEALDATIDLVIAGGESGPKARPMHPDWVRSLRDQCAEYKTAFFFKQWGEWVSEGQSPPDATFPGEGRDPFGNGEYWAKLGKKRAGRLLDGVEWNGFPDGK